VTTYIHTLTNMNTTKKPTTKTNGEFNVEEGFRLMNERIAQGLDFFPHVVVVDGRFHFSFDLGEDGISVGSLDPALTLEAAAAETAAIIAATKESIIAAEKKSVIAAEKAAIIAATKESIIAKNEY